jgi:CRP-like cAMP-binding protein
MDIAQFEHLQLFDNLTPAQSATVRKLFASIEEHSGSVLFCQGDIAEYLYIVADGEVLIEYKPDDGPALTIARIRANGVVGWSAALGSPNYTSSAVCITDSTLLRVCGADLRDFCQQNPETGVLLVERLAAVIAKRLRNTHGQVLALLEQGLRTDFKKPVEAEHFAR